MITVCKRFEFCYGHRLPGYPGKCDRYHGHNSVVEVEVIRVHGQSPYPTMVIDFSDLKNLVGPILEEIDHNDLTEFFVVPPDGGPPHEIAPPTAEVICQWLATRIQLALPDGVELARLRVTETPDSWAEWKERR